MSTKSPQTQAALTTRVDAPQPTPLPTRRALWATKRAALESVHAKSQPKGGSFKRRWELFEELTKIFGVFLKLSGLSKVGFKNACTVKLKEITLEYEDLPKNFGGYRVLHLTDMHLDFIPGIEKAIISAIKQIQSPVDLAIITGDFREAVDNGFREILGPLEAIKDAIQTKDGLYATLGNHDTVNMVPEFERLGIRVLTNETVTLQRENEQICFTGLDDVHYFYTEYALEAIENSPDLFKMIFVHSAEVYAPAATNNYRLYLAGHTHGGQICLPGGIPIITHHTAGRKRARGLWKFKGLTGYTSQGAGSIGIPARFFSTGEVTVFTLRRK